VSRAERAAVHWPARTAGRRARGDRHELVRLVTRLVIAQTGLAAAIGLPYSRRHLPSVVITLMLAAALWGLAMVVRSGTHAAWTIAIGFEIAYIIFGLFRFFTSRYLGGTLFAIITLGTLLQPAVARAFAGQQGRGRPDALGTRLPDVAEGALEGGAGS